MSKIVPCLWFNGQAEEAARFYTSLLPDSKIGAIVRSVIDTPGAKVGEVITVEFTVAGQDYLGLNGGPDFPFTNAVSFIINCADQAEVDRLWDALLEGGGQPVQCGWLTDRFGLSWQIVPEAAMAMLRDQDPAKVKRYFEAMVQMVKLDLPTLQKAFDGVGNRS